MVTFEPGARVADRRCCGRVGRVLGPARLGGAVLVQWDGHPGANVVRAAWLVAAESLKLCL